MIATERTVFSARGFTPVICRSEPDEIPMPCGFQHPDRPDVKCKRIGKCEGETPHIGIVGNRQGHRAWIEFSVPSKHSKERE